jgi:preprotein translocase subunit SecY
MDRVLTKKFLELPLKKIFYTLVAILLYKIGNTVPVINLDNDAFQKSFSQLENKNMLMQYINLYSGEKHTKLTNFSLGIIPFINASILFDLFVTIFPSLEKLQREEGDIARKKFLFYKKLITLFFAFLQAISLIFYFKPYFYDTKFSSLALDLVILIGGSLTIVWLSNFIDNKGIGNGTSILILTNILLNFTNKMESNLFFDKSLAFLFIIFLFFLICFSQTARIPIDIVSARQLAFLEDAEKSKNENFSSSLTSLKKKGLSIRLNQAGIFPIIIASNLLPFLGIFSNLKMFIPFLYYILIIGCSYLYTTLFWDPEKIANELRKASVSIINIRPGKDTISYLKNVVFSSSLLGGIFLCIILILYEFVSKLLNPSVLNQLNISSLIIGIGILYEIQKNLQALYKNSNEII